MQDFTGLYENDSSNSAKTDLIDIQNTDSAEMILKYMERADI